ncbi:MAG: hypothetical protein IJY28_02235 [Clostridia bacterium]|nr:hypothetical protein [Clostridia bacterium]
MYMEMVPMDIDITEDLMQIIQEYLGYFEAYLHTGITAGTWILAVGAVTVAVVLISQERHVRQFFRRKRIKR